MKEKELYVDYEPQQSIYYVEKEDNTYGPVLSGAFMAKHYLDDYFDKIKNWEESLKDSLRKNEISPIYYYMILQGYGVGDLASRVKTSRRRLKKHCQMKNFIKLRLSRLKRYAEAFDVPVASMFQLIITKEKNNKSLCIDHLKTDNPYFTFLKMELK